MNNEDAILTELRTNREASAKEHANLLAKLTELETDLRGDLNRDIEGIIPKVRRHDKLLKPVELLSVYPRLSLVMLFVLLHLLAYASFKGIDKIITLF
jgi:hypothetical protein